MQRTWIAVMTMWALVGCVEPGPPMAADEPAFDPAGDGLAGAPALADVLPKAITPIGGVAVGDLARDPSLPVELMTYHGGPVMLGPTKVYLIWYGYWEGNSAPTIVTNLVRNLGGSSWFAINTTYPDGAGHGVPNALAYGGAATDAYSQGTELSDLDVWQVVTGAIASAHVPRDPSAVYVVLTSADVDVSSGLCSHYCGWHTSGVDGGSRLRFALIGDAARCPQACEPQAISPSGNAGADAMASTIAHELSETVTDPDLDAWYDGHGEENADKCAWKFGTTYKVPGGARANVKLGGRDYLLQENWVNVGIGRCAQSY